MTLCSATTTTPATSTTARARHLGLLLCLALSVWACASTPAARPRALPPGHTGAFTTYWSDTQPREVGHYKDGLRHGPLEAFHENGALELKGVFVEGVPEGMLEIFDAQGRRVRSEQWKDARLEGLQSTFRPDGSVASTTEYHRGRPHGEHRDFDASGRLTVSGRWHDGLRAGCWRQFDPTGRVLRETYQFVSRGQPVGAVDTTFHADGRIAQVIRARSDGVERSWLTEWHRNGRQAAVLSLLDGRQHGLDVTWSDAGVKLREGRLADDERVGTWTWWDEEGRLRRSVRYEDGVEQPESDGDA